MKTIRTFPIKTWLPVSILVLMFFLFALTILMNHLQDRKALLEGSLKTVQYDVATLAREIEQLLLTEHDQDIPSSLIARTVNTHYRAIFIYNLVTNQIETEAITSPLTSEYLTLTDQDLANLESMRSRKLALVSFDESNEIITAFFSIPLQIENFHNLREGVLIARYSIKNELAMITQQTYAQSILYALVFIAITAAFLWAYRQFIQRPVQQLIKIIEYFSKNRMVLEPNISGQGELREIADALQSMSEDIVMLNDERDDAQREARQRRYVFDSVFSVIPDLFFLLEDDLTIRDFRVAKEDELYVPPESFLNKRMDAVLPAKIGELFSEHLAIALASNDMVSFEYQLPKQGQQRYFEARLAPIPKTNQVVAVIRDVTQQKENELLILHQAHYDSLTDLPNRYLALDRLKHYIVAAKRDKSKIAVMFLDLDDFKKVNDTLGHRVGDEVLIEIAQRLIESVSKNDTVARLGGDEFVVLFDNFESVDALLNRVKDISEKLNRPIRSANRDLQVAASIGICTYPDDGRNETELLRSADTAMYHAKAHGKNQFAFYAKKMNEDMTRRLRVEECMLNALKNGEYEVFYQPQFNLLKNKLVAAEALLRWHSPELGEVSPAEFIPISEQNGQIIDIGQFVISQAIKQCAQWRKILSSSFRIAINLSPRQFRDDSVLHYIKEQLEHHQLEGKYLEFEVTEGVLLRGYESVNQVLLGLHEAGISISMDDFGTGYSSLSYLQDYPFDTVKIDRSFINNMLTSEDSHELVKAIISMAHDLKLMVIAEGVETSEQAASLREFGCDLIQGYLMGPALNRADFIARWKNADVQVYEIS